MHNKISTVFSLLLLLTGFLPAIVSANNGEICRKGLLMQVDARRGVPSVDTIPTVVRAETRGSKPISDKPATGVIKQVPKARKVALPRPVTVKVKPVKVVKPRLIKPVLKVF